MSKAKGCAAGLLLGSFLRALVTLLGVVSKVLASILWYTGLWVPGVYALFGGVLYLGWHFNPLAGGLYPTLYLIGFGLCALICLIVLVHNLIVKPFKSVAEGYRHPVWSKDKDEEEGGKADKKKLDKDELAWKKTRLEHERKKALKRGKKAGLLSADSNSATEDNEGYGLLNASSGDLDDLYGYRNARNSVEKEEAEDYTEYAATAEQPKIYLSAVERDTLIHEYADRFEVYDLDGGKKTLRSIEYKGERH